MRAQIVTGISAASFSEPGKIMSTLPAGETKLHRILRLTHLWLGVSLLIPLVAIGISGTILTFNHEIADLHAPAGFTATTEGEPRPMSELLATARPLAPEGSNAAMIVFPEDRADPATVRFQRRGAQGPGGIHQVMIDPVTLKVFSSEPFSNDGFMRIMHRLHGSLLISGGLGREIVGWLGVVMLALGISGLIMWWPKTKQSIAAAFKVTRGAHGFRLHRELHGALGIWSWLVFIVVSFSGVYIAFPNVTGSVIRAVFPAGETGINLNTVTVQPAQDARPIGIDEAARLAIAALPETRVWTARYPTRPDQPYRFGLIRPGHEHGQPAAQVAVDPWTGTVVGVLDPETYTTGETIMAWQRGLHAGEGLGWTWKILVALSGLLPLIFGITGCAMWLMRRRARNRIAQRTVTQGVRS
jgi:uncharacterized iron-regulated membrane protein